MRLRSFAPVLIALALLPAACKREAAPAGAAAGEILPGSASDAMLPADRVTSQPPLDPRAERGAGGAEAKASGAPAGATGAAAAEPAAEGTAGAE